MWVFLVSDSERKIGKVQGTSPPFQVEKTMPTLGSAIRYRSHEMKRRFAKLRWLLCSGLVCGSTPLGCSSEPSSGQPPPQIDTTVTLTGTTSTSTASTTFGATSTAGVSTTAAAPQTSGTSATGATSSTAGGGGSASSTNASSVGGAANTTTTTTTATTTGGGVDPGADGFYRLERLNRGVVAVSVDGGVYVGWRMYGYEYSADAPESVSYNLYRDGVLLANVTDSTNYFDPDGTASSSYSVAPVFPAGEGAISEPVTALSENYVRVPLESPSANAHHAGDGSAADLDGDGDLELVLKWEANNAQDNANAGVTDNVYLDGLELDGTRKWRIDLGPNIRAGAHYTQFIVYDLDGDGKAELTVKTAPGTRDGTGEFLRLGPAANDDDGAIYRNSEGYVLSGPEYLTVFSGDTGEELATVDFDVGRGTVSAWGDNYGNRVDRFLATAAHLDDTGLASVVMARGYYTRTTLTAWNFRNGQLSQLWKFDSNQAGESWTGQGAHSLSVANADDDLGQEIIYGAMTIDHDGTGLCNTGLNHGDALHVTDLIPSRPGLEVFMPHEYDDRPTFSLRDAGTCEVIHRGPNTDTDVGRGVAADVTPANPGAEMWASSGVPFMSASSGQTISGSPNSINFLIWWDADESRELEDGTAVQKFGGGNLQTCGSCSANNGTKSTPVLVADLLGDWREEVIWRETNNSALRIYTTTDVTTRRIYTLMHDPQYRVAISWQNVAYNQPPHPSFHIGGGMADPPEPNISVE